MNSPEVFRAHNYTITSDGHLQRKNRPAASVAIYGRKHVDRDEPPEVAAMYEPIPQEELEPEPVIVITPKPTKQKDVHVDNVTQVAALVRKGFSFAQAMEMVLDGEEEVAIAA